MVFLIHGKEKVNTTTDFGLSYACLNIAGVLKGYWFLEKKNNIWYQAVSIWKTIGVIVKVNMAA